MTITSTTADRIALRDGIRAIGLESGSAARTSSTTSTCTSRRTIHRNHRPVRHRQDHAAARPRGPDRPHRTPHHDGSSTPRTGGIAMLAQHPRQENNPRWTLRRIIAERPPSPAVTPTSTGSRSGWARRRPPAPGTRTGQRRPAPACLPRPRPRPATDYLLCDEPTAMLDPVAARGVVATLAELADDGVGIVLVSHNHGLVRALYAHAVLG